MAKTTQKKKDLIRSNSDIRDELYIRITDLRLTYNAIEKDAAQLGRTIPKPRLSQYFQKSNTQLAFSITQEDLIWLCDRYGIDINIKVKRKRYDDRTMKQYIKRKYDRKNGEQLELDKATGGRGSEQNKGFFQETSP